MSFFVTERGTKIFFDTYGDATARTLLLLHGWFATSSFWSEQLPMLTEMGYHIVTLDSRGHGQSGKPAWGYTLDILIRGLEQMLEYLDIEECSIIGHSGGAGIAQAYYLVHPEQIKVLVLMNSTFTVQHTFFGSVLKNFGKFGFKIGYHPLIHTGMKQFLLYFSPLVSLFTHQPMERVEKWIDDAMDIPYWVASKELKTILKFNILPSLDDIQAPTLIIAGERDFITPAKMSKTLAEHIPNAELHILTAANHLAPILRAPEVNPLLRRFLNEYYPPQPKTLTEGQEVVTPTIEFEG